jgi:hypothetical protein
MSLCIMKKKYSDNLKIKSMKFNEPLSIDIEIRLKSWRKKFFVSFGRVSESGSRQSTHSSYNVIRKVLEFISQFFSESQFLEPLIYSPSFSVKMRPKIQPIIDCFNQEIVTTQFAVNYVTYFQFFLFFQLGFNELYCTIEIYYYT